jgi:hypothetical protein
VEREQDNKGASSRCSLRLYDVGTVCLDAIHERRNVDHYPD